MKKLTSADRLQKFLRDEYMKKGGADNLETAVRDCLTDMFHVWDNVISIVPLEDKLDDAKQVYYDEKAEEFNNSKAQCKDY